MPELSPTDRQKLEALLVIVGEIKRSLEAETKRTDGVEGHIREMLKDGLTKESA